MNKAILVGVAFVILCSSVIVSVEAKGVTLKDYIDPYNRYSIQYPAKWQIQIDPVHTEGNYLYETALQIGDNKGSTLSVLESEKASTLSLREYASIIQNDMPLPTKVLNPVTCVGESVCMYFYSANLGFTGEVGQMTSLYSGAGDKVFSVTATFRADQPIDTDQFVDIENSFNLLKY
jgi:hypothetical protein